MIQPSAANVARTGAYRPKAQAQIRTNLEFCFEGFPRLKERSKQLAGSMSGGEQPMLALARALMLAPRIPLVDEPSVGLATGLSASFLGKIHPQDFTKSRTILGPGT